MWRNAHLRHCMGYNTGFYKMYKVFLLKKIARSNEDSENNLTFALFMKFRVSLLYNTFSWRWMKTFGTCGWGLQKALIELSCSAWRRSNLEKKTMPLESQISSFSKYQLDIFSMCSYKHKNIQIQNIFRCNKTTSLENELDLVFN